MRKTAKKTARRTRTIDIHAHWYPREWLELFERDGAKEGARIERSVANGGERYTVRTERISNAFSEEFVALERRIRGMDRTGVDAQAMSLTTPMVYFASRDFGLALAQCYNDCAAAAHAKYPERLFGLAQVPMQAPDLAVRELERAAKLPGMKGLYLATNINGTDLDDRKFWDVYAACEALGWTIFLHPVDTVGRDRTAKYYLRNLCGNPYDTGLAAAHLIFGGVLDQFPKLSFNLPHAGGTMPALVGRWDHGTKVRPELKHLKRKPSAYLRRFTYDTIAHDDAIAMNLVRQVGADRVLLGSDYCFDMGLDQPVKTVNRWNGLKPAEREQILGKTAAKILKLSS